MKRILFVCATEYEEYVAPVLAVLRSMSHLEPQLLSLEELDYRRTEIEACDLLVTVHSSVKKVLDLCDSLKGKVPSLTLQDGIIEHRSSSHRVQGVFRFRPLHTDYIAAFGHHSRNLLVAGGVPADRIRLTGCPRFDAYVSVPDPSPDGYLLITTANRPAHNPKTLPAFFHLMNQLIEYCEEREIAYKFRPSRGIAHGAIESLDKVSSLVSAEVASRFANIQPTTTTLLEDLKGASAVITTPSTVSIEAMVTNRPLAHLLFDSQTVYLPSAWCIRHEHDIPTVVDELLAPPRFKMPYQQVILEENLSYIGGSANRVGALINELVT